MIDSAGQGRKDRGGITGHNFQQSRMDMTVASQSTPSSAVPVRGPAQSAGCAARFQTSESVIAHCRSAATDDRLVIGYTWYGAHAIGLIQ